MTWTPPNGTYPIWPPPQPPGPRGPGFGWRFAHSLWVAVGLLVVAGAADFVSAVYRQAILQTYVPDRLRGRLQGVFTVVVNGGPRLGDLRAGFMAAATTFTLAWSGAAVLCIAVVIVGAVCVRPFWRYDAQAVHAPAVVGDPAPDELRSN